MNEALVQLLLRVAEELNPTLPHPIELGRGAEAGLYGPGGVLDSLSLVRFIVAVEAAAEDTFGRPVVVASDRAVAQKRNPFLTVGALAAYLADVLNETGSARSD